jgi:hypothetical protein
MIELILDEIKNVIKEKLSWLIVVFICILSFYLVYDLNNKSKEFENDLPVQVQNQIQTTLNDITIIDIGIKTGNIGNQKINQSNALEYKETLNLLLESLKRKEVALNNQDWETYHKEQLFYDYWYLSNLVFDIDQLKNQKLIDESSEFFKLQSEVKSQMNYPELVFSSDGMSNVLREYKYLLKNRLMYSYQIVQNEVFTQPVNRYTVNGSTFIYQFLSQYWFVLLVLQLLLITNRIDKHKSFAKFIVSLTNSFVVLILPIALISFILFLFNGFNQLNLPVLTNSIGLSSFSGIENNLENDFLGYGGNFSIGLSYFSSYPQGSGEMHPYLSFIKLKDFYGFVGLLSIFNTLFITSFIQLITNNIKQSKLALGIIVSITCIGIFLTKIDPNAFISKFNPFAGFDMILLNGGSSSITLLNSLIVLIISTIILLGINRYLINKTSS